MFYVLTYFQNSPCGGLKIPEGVLHRDLVFVLIFVFVFVFVFAFD